MAVIHNQECRRSEVVIQLSVIPTPWEYQRPTPVRLQFPLSDLQRYTLNSFAYVCDRLQEIADNVNGSESGSSTPRRIEGTRLHLDGN
jgi:hypothetical protein